MTSALLTVPLWTLALLISAAGLVASLNSLRFSRAVAGEARQLWSTPPAPQPFGATPGASLPAPVERYLQMAGAAEGQPPLHAARLTHGGSMTLKPGAAPVPIRGRQYVSADPPGFVWWGRIRLAPGAWIDARDKVIDGTGEMKVMVESTKTLQVATGPELDQGALIRLLGELAWMPTVLRDRRYVRWEAIDDHQARAFLTVNGKRVGAVFHFGPDGLPVRFTAERYRDMGPGQPAVLAPFVGTLGDWREVPLGDRQLLVPFHVEGAWVIDGQLFTFARFDVQRLEVDRPESF
jgi:hypothetical protein